MEGTMRDQPQDPYRMPDQSAGHVEEPHKPRDKIEQSSTMPAAEVGCDLGEPAAAGGPGDLEPGIWVRHPGQPDWGQGQVQSVIGPRVTVNFENAGKILVNVQVVKLERID
jgi:hypothetical protein